MKKGNSMQIEAFLSSDHNDTNLFEPATVAEITSLIQSSQNKECELDPIQSFYSKLIGLLCIPTLVPTITKDHQPVSIYLCFSKAQSLNQLSKPSPDNWKSSP